MHNFHLIGPGVDEEVTDVAFVGEKSVTVTLEPGTYVPVRPARRERHERHLHRHVR